MKNEKKFKRKGRAFLGLFLAAAMMAGNLLSTPATAYAGAPVTSVTGTESGAAAGSTSATPSTTGTESGASTGSTTTNTGTESTSTPAATGTSTPANTGTGTAVTIGNDITRESGIKLTDLYLADRNNVETVLGYFYQNGVQTPKDQRPKLLDASPITFKYTWNLDRAIVAQLDNTKYIEIELPTAPYNSSSYIRPFQTMNTVAKVVPEDGSGSFDIGNYSIYTRDSKYFLRLDFNQTSEYYAEKFNGGDAKNCYVVFNSYVSWGHKLGRNDLKMLIPQCDGSVEELTDLEAPTSISAHAPEERKKNDPLIKSYYFSAEKEADGSGIAYCILDINYDKAKNMFAPGFNPSSVEVSDVVLQDLRENMKVITGGRTLEPELTLDPSSASISVNLVKPFQKSDGSIVLDGNHPYNETIYSPKYSEYTKTKRAHLVRNIDIAAFENSLEDGNVIVKLNKIPTGVTYKEVFSEFRREMNGVLYTGIEGAINCYKELGRITEWQAERMMDAYVNKNMPVMTFRIYFELKFKYVRLGDSFENNASLERTIGSSSSGGSSGGSGGSGSGTGSSNRERYEVKAKTSTVGSFKYQISSGGSTKSDYITVDIQKVWLNANGDVMSNDKIPVNNIKVRLLADGAQVGDDITLSANSDPGLAWKHTLPGQLPRYKSGKTIKYSLQEIDSIQGFKAPTFEMEDWNTSYRLVLKNQESKEFTSITITKEWYDETGNKLTNVNIPVNVDVIWYDRSNGDALKVARENVVLSPATGWTAEVTGLDKVDGNGNVIKYLVKERTVPAGYYPDYNQDTYTIKNRRIPKMNLPVIKQWLDAKGVDISATYRKIPDKITVELLADGNRVTTADVLKSNGWKYEFKDLPKINDFGSTINYEVKEISALPEGFRVIERTVSVDGVIQAQIINQRVEGPTVSLTINKVWMDNDGNAVTNAFSLPDNISVNILADGKLLNTVYVRKSEGWKLTVPNLAKTDSLTGDEIVYSLQETNVASGYVSTITKSASGLSFTITNKQNPTNPVILIPGVTPGEIIPDGNVPASPVESVNVTPDQTVEEYLLADEDVAKAGTDEEITDDMPLEGLLPKTGEVRYLMLLAVVAGLSAAMLVIVKKRSDKSNK